MLHLATSAVPCHVTYRETSITHTRTSYTAQALLHAGGKKITEQYEEHTDRNIQTDKSRYRSVTTNNTWHLRMFYHILKISMQLC